MSEVSVRPEVAPAPAKSPDAAPAGAGALAVYNLGKRYGARAVVQDVSLLVRQGEAVGLLGPNGAGKTTVFYMITGLVKPDKGIIALDGHDVTALPMYQRARLGVGYLPQEASIFRGLNVEDNIRAVLEVVERDRKRARASARATAGGVRHRATAQGALDRALGRRAAACEIARALAGKPSFMLLDEPFAGIDPIAVGDIQDLVRHLEAARHRRAHHRPQRARDARAHRPRLHHPQRPGADRGAAGRDHRAPRGAQAISRREFSDVREGAPLDAGVREGT